MGTASTIITNDAIRKIKATPVIPLVTSATTSGVTPVTTTGPKKQAGLGKAMRLMKTSTTTGQKKWNAY